MIDYNELLQPFSETHPAGQDMSFSAEFDQVQEARREEDSSLEQGDWVRDVKEAEWAKVNNLSEKLLLTQTKDIRVAGWLLEARMKLQGFQGLQDGLLLLDGLCHQFWESVHPVIDEEGGLQTRAGNLAWILGRAQELAAYVPLTNIEGGRYGLAHWESAAQLDNAIRRSPDEANSLSVGRITIEDIQNALARTPENYLKTQYAALQSCKEVVKEVDNRFQSLLAEESPSFSGLSTVLLNASDLLERFASELGIKLVIAGPASVGSSQHEKPFVLDEEQQQASSKIEPTLTLPEEVPPMGIEQRQIMSRKQALQQLRQIAAFFRATEPHSPVGYMAGKAAEWGDMPLHEWLTEVVKNPEILAALHEQLGVSC